MQGHKLAPVASLTELETSQYGWTISPAEEVKPLFLHVRRTSLGSTTVTTQRMLESAAEMVSYSILTSGYIIICFIFLICFTTGGRIVKKQFLTKKQQKTITKQKRKTNKNSCFIDAKVELKGLYYLVSTTGCDFGAVRLLGGVNNREGRVEICYNNVWGTICDDAWGNVDARVVCRQLGLSTNGALRISAGFEVGTGRIWLDQVQCRGNEDLLIACPALPIGNQNCMGDHNEDAGVRCQAGQYCT